MKAIAYCPECLKAADLYEDEEYVFGLGFRKAWFTTCHDVHPIYDRREALLHWFRERKEQGGFFADAIDITVGFHLQRRAA